MRLLAIVLAGATVARAQNPPRAPQRVVPDPGVVATGLRVTPAGVQTVFDGRVSGVRFGRTPDELWVTAPDYAYRVSWRANTLLARARVDGRNGVFSVAIDPATGRALVSSVGRLPTAQGRQPSVSQLSSFDPGDTGVALKARTNSGALGDFMAGAPAVASRAAPDGHRYAVLPLPANDSLALLDAESGALMRKIGLGVEPIAAVITPDGRTAYVTIFGGPKPTLDQRAATECCDLRAEAVRVDARGIADAGVVSRVDLAAGTVIRNIGVGRHPTAIVGDARGLLYVADGNSDAVSVIDTKTDAVTATITVAPFRERQIGLAPTALAVSPDASTLYVALGGVNAVAMYDVSAGATKARLLGLIPTAWYPSSLDVSADGKFLAIGARFGIGAGTGKAGGSPGKEGRYVFAERGSVSVVPVPTGAELIAYSSAVSENDRLHLAAAAPPAPERADARPQAVPNRPGDPSLIKHVVFIVKENRTYDQVLGDLGRGSSDSSLTIFGRDVTPNAHALSEQFVTLDHFFASGGNSADGHQWLTQANETDYPMWPRYFGRTSPSEGIDALAYSSGGFLWEAAQTRGKSVTVFGEYAPSIRNSSASVRSTLLAQWNERPTDFTHHRELLAARYNTRSAIPSLDRALVRDYPGWTQEVPDVVKAGDIRAYLNDWDAKGEMPDLVMVILPNDHTQGTSANWPTPRASVADNDYGLGIIVEGLSHSRFWRDMAIFVVEDDAQDGVDHVDGHRTVALAISPYARRGAVDSTFYSHPSMVKTIELMLGLPSMSLFDLVATDMRNSFIPPGATPNLGAYTALVPTQSIAETNHRPGDINGADAAERRDAARQSARMDFDDPDDAPSDLLNRILWHDAKGWKTPYPGINHSLFFPLSVMIPDENRTVRK